MSLLVPNQLRKAKHEDRDLMAEDQAQELSGHQLAGTRMDAIQGDAAGAVEKGADFDGGGFLGDGTKLQPALNQIWKIGHVVKRAEYSTFGLEDMDATYQSRLNPSAKDERATDAGTREPSLARRSPDVPIDVAHTDQSHLSPINPGGVGGGDGLQTTSDVGVRGSGVGTGEVADNPITEVDEQGPQDERVRIAKGLKKRAAVATAWVRTHASTDLQKLSQALLGLDKLSSTRAFKEVLKKLPEKLVGAYKSSGGRKSLDTLAREAGSPLSKDMRNLMANVGVPPLSTHGIAEHRSMDMLRPITKRKVTPIDAAEIAEAGKRRWSGRHLARPGEVTIPATISGEIPHGEGSSSLLFRGNPLPSSGSAVMSRHPDVAAGYATGNSVWQKSPGTSDLFAYQRSSMPRHMETAADILRYDEGNRFLKATKIDQVKADATESLLARQKQFKSVMPMKDSPAMGVIQNYGRVHPTYETAMKANMAARRKPLGSYKVRPVRTVDMQPAYAVSDVSGASASSVFRKEGQLKHAYDVFDADPATLGSSGPPVHFKMPGKVKTSEGDVAPGRLQSAAQALVEPMAPLPATNPIAEAKKEVSDVRKASSLVRKILNSQPLI